MRLIQQNSAESVHFLIDDACNLSTFRLSPTNKMGRGNPSISSLFLKREPCSTKPIGPRHILRYLR
jgi:hypothetical protein